MAKKRVVPGSITDPYKRREGDFSPDLVGFQLTNGTALFTLGNFAITTNTGSKLSKVFNTGVFSDPYTLETLNITNEESSLLVSNDIFTTLNVDTQNIDRFVYFGSLVEFIRVNIEGVISKWLGSLYITDQLDGYSYSVKNTVLGYSYDTNTNTSRLTIPTQYIDNKFGLDYEATGGLLLDATDISQIELSYNNYELYNDFGSFNILGYTGSTEPTNPYIKVILSGETFPTLSATTFGTFRYHIKPKSDIVDKLFFDNLTDFENVLMNRLVEPKYTSFFEGIIETESGNFVTARKRFTWPTTDGFNIDVNTVEYDRYLSTLLKLGYDYDNSKTDLISRRFVSQSIQEFDTVGGGDETTGRKMNKLLRIYGREFDEIKKYTDAIKFTNVVTYDGRDNTPDELIKILAKTMGFESIQSVSDNQLLSYISKVNGSIFSGHSRDMSMKEIDTELWRRLVINAWWLYKSKGTRKVVEFFIKLFGLHTCLINFDEIVYVVNDKLDRSKIFTKVSNILGFSGDTSQLTLSDYPIDSEGFPKTLPQTPEYYFQMNGFWYNGGTDRVTGNNPHIGPYDYGSKYFQKFTCFVDGHTGTPTQQNYIESVNLFTDYNNGDLEITFEDGKPLLDYGDGYATIMNDNGRISNGSVVVKAGFTTDISRTGRGSLHITFSKGSNDDTCVIGVEPKEPCPITYLDPRTGLVLTKDITTSVITEDCCNEYGYIYLPIKKPTVTDTSEDISWSNLRESFDILYTEEIISVFSESTGEPTTPSNYCYWCPPSRTICDGSEYTNQQSNDELIELFIEVGYISEVDSQNLTQQQIDDLKSLHTNVINQVISIYGCIVVNDHDNNDPESQECCELRGGNWININNTNPKQPIYKCISLNETPIVECSRGESFTLEMTNNTVSEVCCGKNLGVDHWVKTITVYNLDGTISEIIDLSGNECSYCKSEIYVTYDSTYGYIYVYSDGTKISTECCTVINGVLNSDSICGLCSRITLNPETGVLSSNIPITELCCESNGYYWSNNRCNQCPTNIGTINSTINGSNYTEYVYFNDNTDTTTNTIIDRKCCGDVGGTIIVDSDGNNRCILEPYKACLYTLPETEEFIYKEFLKYPKTNPGPNWVFKISEITVNGINYITTPINITITNSELLAGIWPISNAGFTNFWGLGTFADPYTYEPTDAYWRHTGELIGGVGNGVSDLFCIKLNSILDSLGVDLIVNVKKVDNTVNTSSILNQYIDNGNAIGGIAPSISTPPTYIKLRGLRDNFFISKKSTTTFRIVIESLRNNGQIYFYDHNNTGTIDKITGLVNYDTFSDDCNYLTNSDGSIRQ